VAKQEFKQSHRSLRNYVPTITHHHTLTKHDICRGAASGLPHAGSPGVEVLHPCPLRSLQAWWHQVPLAGCLSGTCFPAQKQVTSRMRCTTDTQHHNHNSKHISGNGMIVAMIVANHDCCNDCCKSWLLQITGCTICWLCIIGKI
jgi:hypothetical protein